MSKRLDEDLGTIGYDGLIASTFPAADVVAVKIAANNGVLARGTVVSGLPGGELAPLSAAIEAENAAYVLTDETDTGSGAAVVATAYRTGHFVSDKLAVKAGYTLTDADKEILRKSGILLSDAIGY